MSMAGEMRKRSRSSSSEDFPASQIETEHPTKLQKVDDEVITSGDNAKNKETGDIPEKLLTAIKDDDVNLMMQVIREHGFTARTKFQGPFGELVCLLECPITYAPKKSAFLKKLLEILEPGEKLEKFIDDDSDSPVHRAIDNWSGPAMKALFTFQPDIMNNAVNCAGRTPLMELVRNYSRADAEMVKAIIETSGLDVNIQYPVPVREDLDDDVIILEPEGETVLHTIARKIQCIDLPILKQMMAAFKGKMNGTIKNAKGQTALDILDGKTDPRYKFMMSKVAYMKDCIPEGTN